MTFKDGSGRRPDRLADVHSVAAICPVSVACSQGATARGTPSRVDALPRKSGRPCWRRSGIFGWALVLCVTFTLLHWGAPRPSSPGPKPGALSFLAARCTLRAAPALQPPGLFIFPSGCPEAHYEIWEYC